MAISSLFGLVKVENNGSSIIVAGLEIQVGSKSLAHKVQTSVSFPRSFKNMCYMVIPYCTQLGFSAGSTLSVGNISASGCTMYNANQASALMNIYYIAIGY
jgi:hypothetical protein